MPALAAPGASSEVALSTEELEDLARVLDRGLVKAALTRAALVRSGLAHLSTRLGPLEGLEPPIALRLIGVVLAERKRPFPVVRLVWTGPEAISATARDTATVVRELFQRARRSVLIAGYRFDHGLEILEPLHRAMAERGVRCSIFLDIPPAPTREQVRAHIDTWLNDFLLTNWPFALCPRILFDPRSAEPGSRVSLHAKCIVVDERESLVTSANFTNRGQARNVEVGSLIEDEPFARSLVAHWMSAVATGLFCEVKSHQR